MAAFDSAAFDIAAFDVSAFDLGTTNDVCAFDGDAFDANAFDSDAFGICGGDTPVPPQTLTQTPAGRKTRQRYYVEVDGQTFVVKSAAHARALLDRAKELAVSAAKEQAQAVVAKRDPAAKVIKRIKLQKPVIRTDAPLNLQSYYRDIAQIYNEAARNAELFLLMQRKLDEEDDDDALLLV